MDFKGVIAEFALLKGANMRPLPHKAALLVLLPVFGALAAGESPARKSWEDNSPSAAVSARRIELMKCWSKENGTLWASFGHQIDSGSNAVTTFPTEIVVFEPNGAARLVLDRLADSLSMPITVCQNCLSWSFQLTLGEDRQLHRLRVTNYDMQFRNSYVGVWSIVRSGSDETVGSVGCTADVAD